MSVASMTNHFLENSSSENGFHLPRIGSYTSTPPRAMSRVSSLGEMVDRLSNDRHEQLGERKKEFAYRLKKQQAKKDSDHFESVSMSSFHSEGNVRAVYAPDINKVSMPIFGTRPPTSASTTSSSSYMMPSTSRQPQVDIEEYYQLLKDKIRVNYHEIKTKFRNADTEGKGGVTKEALAHILAAVFGQSKPLSHYSFLKLLEKMDLKNQQHIRFDHFTQALQVNKTESVSEWCDPIRGASSASSHKVDRSFRKNGYVMNILKENAKLRTKEIVDLVGDGSKKIFKPELLNYINGMSIKIETEEFEKLWKKFDSENYGFVKGNAFLKRLGVSSESENNTKELMSFEDDQSIDESESDFNNIPYANINEIRSGSRKSSRGSSRGGKKSNNPIEVWLKTRFRDGFKRIKASFEEIDKQKTGQVRREQFLNVLNQHNFKLESNLLDAFLERCDIKVPGSQYNNTTLISYTDFLEKFQNRSDKGLAYRMITNSDMSDNKSTSTLGLVEGRLLKLFQNDFLSLLQVFRKIDRNKTNSLNKQEFRAAIESHFQIELTDEEFEEFHRELPKDSLNKIKYLEFMTRFDTDASSTLFDTRSDSPKASKRREYEPIIEENEDSDNQTRSLDHLNQIIKDVVKTQYKAVEVAWNNLDVSNENQMNKDMMFKLFKKLSISPAITREEVNLIWGNMLLNDNKKLAYWQFIRHFGYNKKSAAFVNSKKAPPKKGDNDMMLTSNKLGRDSILIRGSVQSKLYLQCEVLKRSFQDMDPYKTNLVLKDEFEEILIEICEEISSKELDYIYSMHEVRGDKINYMEFLAPYSAESKFSRESNRPDKIIVRVHEDGMLSHRSIDMNDPVIQKVRSKLSDKHKQLRMIFKQYDPSQSGYVTIKNFDDVLKQAQCVLTKDEIFTLSKTLDKNKSGLVNYTKFITEIVKS